MPSSRSTGTAMLTLPAMSSPSVIAMPSETMAASSAPGSAVPAPVASVDRGLQDLLLDLGRGVGQEDATESPETELRGAADLEHDAERRAPTAAGAGRLRPGRCGG